ncbi:two-CW domain-containing protein [Thermodesulfobacteriota bacterium]
MPRKNCWEVLHCGREPGGKNVKVAGVCPAATRRDYDGVNGGTNSGRFCWVVAGTLCEGTIQGTHAQKILTCIHCKFFKMVQDEESFDFKQLPDEAKNGKKP